MTCLVLCLLALLIPSASGAMQNFTIDDSQAEYHDGPGCTWKSGPNCGDCVAKLDPSRTRSGTWHEGKYVASGAECSITMEFTGNAVYVYFIVPNHIDEVTSYMNLVFNIDGQDMGGYSHQAGPDSNFQYNTLVYSNTRLTSGHHNLKVSTTGWSNTLSLFDYVVYTDGTPDTPPVVPTSARIIPVIQTDTGTPLVLPPTITTSTPTTDTSTILGTTSAESIVPSSAGVKANPGVPSSGTITSALDPTRTLVSSGGGVPASGSLPSTITDIPFGTLTSVELSKPTAQQLTERQKPVSVTLIVGVIVGGVALVVCMALVLCHYRRRKRREMESARPMVFAEERVSTDYKSKLHLESLGMRCNDAEIGTTSPVGFADGRVDHTAWASAGSSMYCHEGNHVTSNPNANESDRQVRTTANEGSISPIGSGVYPDSLRQFIEGLGLTSDLGGGDTGRIHASQLDEPPPRYR